MNYLSISSDRIIFVDNDPNNEKRRQASRELLLNYLASCQEIYRPKNLDKLSEILKKESIDFDEKKAKEEVEEYYQQEAQKERIDNQLSKVSEVLGGGMNLTSSMITLITAIAGIASCKIM
jgi:hypothetical protein